MNHTRLWVVATIFVVIIVVLFAVFAPRARNVVDDSAPRTTTTGPSVALHDVYKKGVHTISGLLQVPNPCTPISAEAVLSNNSGIPSILVDIKSQESYGVCLERKTLAKFTATIVAPPSLPIRVQINSVLASTTPL